MTLKSALLTGGLLLAGIGAADAAVVRTDLNLRSGPGTGYGVVSVLPAGAEVDVLGCSGGWCRVAWGSAQGYASASYLGGEPAYAVVPPPVVYGPPVVSFGVGFGPGWRGPGWHRGWHGGWRGGWHGHRGPGWHGHRGPGGHGHRHR